MAAAAALGEVAEDLVLCPISQEPMLDAVFCTKSGRTYSEATIREVIRRQGTDPFTKAAITDADLVPNYHVRQAAQEYVQVAQAAEAAQRGDPEETAVRCLLTESWRNADEVLHIESIKRAAVSDRVRDSFEACRRRLGEAKQVQLLHGTKDECVDGILASGFKIPTSFQRDDLKEGNLTFGKAVYFTKSSSKAAEYGDMKTIIVADVVLGKLWTRDDSFESLVPAEVHRKGYHCVYADFNGAGNSEYACYDPEQLLPRWVVSYHTTGADGAALPSEVPMRAGVDELVRFLRSSTRHKEVAFRYIGDCFRDTQRPSIHRVATSCRDPFFTAVLSALRGQNENLVLHALRVLWNMSYEDRRAQGMVLDCIPADAVTDRLTSANESIQLRAAAVLANLCHMETRNHDKILRAKPGRLMLRCVIAAHKRGNTELSTATMTAMANVLQSGARLVSRDEMDPIVALLDSGCAAERDAAAHVLCNAISEGKVDQEWLRKGYKPGLGIDKC